MLGITLEQINELVDITFQDFPWPSATDMIGSFRIESEEDANACAKFMSRHYTFDEILVAAKKHFKRIKSCLKFFEGK